MSTYDEQAGNGRDDLGRDRLGADGTERDGVGAEPAAVIPGDPDADGIAHDDLLGEGVPREDLEGGYTDVDDEGPHVRTVHGQYTETEEYPGPQTVTEGSYVDIDGEQEVVGADEQGEYTDTDVRGRADGTVGDRRRRDDEV